MSMFGYLWLGLQGLGALSLRGEAAPNELARQVLLLCALYCIESWLALVTGVSTMNKWSRSTFALHHVPFIVVVAPALVLLPQPILRSFPRTLALDLFTSFNESLTAARTLGAPRWVDIPRCTFVCGTMTVLIPAEIYELLSVLTCASDATRDSCQSTPGLRLTAALVSLAAMYHILDVLPCNALGLRRAWVECWPRVKKEE